MGTSNSLKKMPLTLDGMRNKIIQITFILTIVNTFVIFIIHAIEQRYDVMSLS